jgi:hypothetical protein
LSGVLGGWRLDYLLFWGFHTISVVGGYIVL